MTAKPGHPLAGIRHIYLRGKLTGRHLALLRSVRKGEAPQAARPRFWAAGCCPR